MKIGHRLMLGFVGVALLVGVVGLFSIYAFNETVESFESGEKHFRSIVEASTELSSYAKRAEGHLTMFVMLHDEVDRKKFFERCQSVDKQIAILEDTVRHPDAVEIVERIKAANTILPAGMDDYLSKPVRAGELMQAIARLIPSLASCALEKEYAL